MRKKKSELWKKKKSKKIERKRRQSFENIEGIKNKSWRKSQNKNINEE